MNGNEIKNQTDFNKIPELLYSDEPDILNDNGVQKNSNDNPQPQSQTKDDSPTLLTNTPENDVQDYEKFNNNRRNIQRRHVFKKPQSRKLYSR